MWELFWGEIKFAAHHEKMGLLCGLKRLRAHQLLLFPDAAKHRNIIILIINAVTFTQLHLYAPYRLSLLCLLQVCSFSPELFHLPKGRVHNLVKKCVTQ